MNLFLVVSIVVLGTTNAMYEFTCPTATSKFDTNALPRFYSTNIRLNFPVELKSVDATLVIDLDAAKMSLDLLEGERHVRYIQRGTQLLVVKYMYDYPTECVVKDSPPSEQYFEDEDAGNSRIIERFFEILRATDLSPLAAMGPTIENGVFVKKFEHCFLKPKINVTFAFTETDWKQSRTSFLHKGLYMVSAEAQVNKDVLTAIFTNFDSKAPFEHNFQPPESVYCEGLKSKISPPPMPNYFSYDSEIIVYKDSLFVAPMSYHRRVYYDYPSKMVRTDFYDAVAENPDLFSGLSANTASIIHDFNAGVQYKIDPTTGSCALDDFQITIGPANFMQSDDLRLPNSLEFFRLNASKITYNGEFHMRGYDTDVFTARVIESSESFIYTWYFSTDLIEIAEDHNVEKNVLLRMDVRIEASEDSEGLAVVNFYDFSKEQPDVMSFDMTACYNANYSKTFIITFPALDVLRGAEKIVKHSVRDAVKKITDLSIYRIFVTEIVFTQSNMFVDVKLLSAPEVLKEAQNEKIYIEDESLKTAASKLNQSVYDKTFTVDVTTVDQRFVFVLKPEDEGIVEYANRNEKIKEHYKRVLDAKEKEIELQKEKERKKEEEMEEERKKERERMRKINEERAEHNGMFAEGSVIALAVGMLVLGTVLGGVLINFAVFRKFGVSFCWKKPVTRDPFSDAHNLESSM